MTVLKILKYNFKVIIKGEIIITGREKPNNRLWKIPITPNLALVEMDDISIPLSCRAIYNDSTKSNLAYFLHVTLLIPVPSTLLVSIKRSHFTTWTGITESLITKHLPKSIATRKCHLRSQQKYIKLNKLTAGLTLAESLSV